MVANSCLQTPILKQRWQGEAWAEEMYDLLANSQITINRRIDIAETYANNMPHMRRQGWKHSTDTKLNLPCLFEPDSEVVTYSSPSEAISKLKQLMAEPKAAAEIAARGYRSTHPEGPYLQTANGGVGEPDPRAPTQDRTDPMKLPKPLTLLDATPTTSTHSKALRTLYLRQHSHAEYS